MNSTTTQCTCPDDCNCRKPWRQNYCGCRAHQQTNRGEQEMLKDRMKLTGEQWAIYWSLRAMGCTVREAYAEAQQS